MHCHSTGVNNQLLESIVEKKVQQETGELAYLQDSMYDFIKTIKEIILGEYAPEFFNDYVNEALKLHGSNLEEFLKIPGMGLELRQALESIDDTINDNTQEFKNQLVALLNKFQTTLDNMEYEARDPYDTAVELGFVGTKEEWLEHLEGDSAYEIAVKNGYEGTQSEWLKYIRADGFIQSLQQFMTAEAGTQVQIPDYGSINSLQTHIRDLYQSGGIAERFKTLVDLQSSSLVDGDYALVADDTDDKNGIYIKDGGVWIKSKYNPSQELYNKLINGFTIAQIKPIQGAAVNSNGTSPILASGSNRAYLKIDVEGFASIDITSTTTNNYEFMFVDENMGSIVRTGLFGDGHLTVPENAKFLLRTHSYNNVTESDDIIIKLNYANKTIEQLASKFETINAINSELDFIKNAGDKFTATVNPIEGFSVKTDVLNPLLAEGPNRSYFKIDVSDATHVKVTNTNENLTSAAWRWKFADADLNAISVVAKYGNTDFDVPENAHYLVRSFRVYDDYENDDITIELTRRSDTKSLNALNTRLKNQALKISILESAKSDMWYKLQADFDAGRTYKLSEFNGSNSDEKIKEAIKFIKIRGHGILDLESGTHTVNSAVLLPSNCWIYLNNAKLKLADNIFDNIIRSDGVIPNPDPFLPAIEVKPNFNIRIFGNNISTSFIEGPDNPYTAPHPIDGGDPIEWVGDFFGWRAIPILLVNTRKFELHDFNVSKSTMWTIALEAGCDEFKIHDIDFDTLNKNGDGIHISMGVTNGEIYNLTGRTSDDLVGIVCLKDYIPTHPHGQYIYPQQIAGYSDYGQGDSVSNIKIRDIAAKSFTNIVRILATGGGKANHITVDNVQDLAGSGVTTATILRVHSSGYGKTGEMGDISNIAVSKITSNHAKTTLKLADNIKDSYFKDYVQNRSDATLLDDTSKKENVILAG